MYPELFNPWYDPLFTIFILLVIIVLLIILVVLLIRRLEELVEIEEELIEENLEMQYALGRKDRPNNDKL